MVCDLRQISTCKVHMCMYLCMSTCLHGMCEYLKYVNVHTHTYMDISRLILKKNFELKKKQVVEKKTEIANPRYFFKISAYSDSASLVTP